jgi:hypothetical protein
MALDMDATRPTLESQIASRLASGVLRRDEPLKTRFARGGEGACAACEARIDTTQFASETRFADRATLRFHRDCYYAWHAARASERGRLALARPCRPPAA